MKMSRWIIPLTQSSLQAISIQLVGQEGFCKENIVGSAVGFKMKVPLTARELVCGTFRDSIECLLAQNIKSLTLSIVSLAGRKRFSVNRFRGVSVRL